MFRVKERADTTAPQGPAPAPRESDPRVRRLSTRARDWLGRRRIQTILALLAYAAFAVYLTWPLVVDLDSRIYGAAGDLTGVISTHREMVDSGEFPFAPGRLGDFNAPDGLEIRWTLNLLTLPSFGSLDALTALFGPIPAVGLYTLLAFTLSGVAMFLLVRRLTGHPGAAFVAGFAYAFYPFVVVKAQGHLDFVHGWVLVLPLWRMLELIERPVARNGIWAGLALIFAFAWTPYHILLAGVMALALSAAAIGLAWRRGVIRQTISALAVVGGIAATFLVGMVLLNQSAPRSEVRTHTVADAVAYSARAAEYVVPTSEHPLVGKRAGEYRAEHLHGSNRSENTLYVGISVLILALVGLVAGARRPGPLRRAAVAAGFVVVAGFAFSAPPQVDLFGFSFPTATQYLFDLTTSWRVFSRLVVVVMAGLVVLAGLGMHGLVRRRPLAIQALVLAVLLVVIAGDLRAARPAHGTNKLLIPTTYQRLASMPQGIAIEYPVVPAEQSMYGDVFYQGWHRKPIVNGYYEDSPEENRALRLTDLSRPATASGLKALGVRYVLVRRDIEAAGLPDPGRPTRDYKLLTEDPYIALYRLELPGPRVLATAMDGFAPTEQSAAGPFQWLTQDDGTIEVRGSCTRCAGTLRIVLGTLGRARDVSIKSPDGRTLVRARVARRTSLRLPLTFERKVDLRIEATPGPQSIAETTGSPDTRSVSISVNDLSFRLDRHRTR